MFLLACLAVQREQLSRFEADVFRLINNLPSALDPVLLPLMQAGNVVAAPVLGLVVVVFNRRRLRAAVDVAGAGAVAWLAARVVKSVVERPRPSGFFPDLFRSIDPGGLGFVSGHAAVAAAIAAAAAPYLPRRWRRAVWILPWVVGIARVYVGAHLPLDIVGGIALGWMVGAAAHLLFGAPHRVPELSDAARVIRRGGSAAVEVERVAGDAKGSFPFTVVTPGGRIFIKLLDPEPRDRDWIYRAARFVAFRDVRDEAAISDGPAQAYREAAMTLLARSSGARVPAVRGIERDGERIWIIQDHVPGRDLTRVDAADVSGAQLRDMWDQLERMHAARLAHRDLVRGNVIIDEQGRAWLVDLAHALSSASSSALDNDAAELVVTTALVVGPERAVAAALGSIGPERMAGVLTELQPLALTPDSRRAIAGDPDMLAALRLGIERAIGVVSTDTLVATPPIGLRAAGAVARSALVGAALVLVAGAGAVADSFDSVGLRRLALGLLAAGVAVVAAAWPLVAAFGRRLAIGRTAAVQLLAHANSVLAGTDAGRRVMVDYLSRAGVQPGEMLDGLARVRRSTWLIYGLALGAGIAAAQEEQVRLHLAPYAPVLVAIAVTASVFQWLLGGRGRHVAGPTPPGGRRLGPATLLAGIAVGAVAELVLTVAVVSAFGPGPAVAAVVAVAIVASLATLTIALPGVVGVEPALLVLGLATVGMDLPTAVGSALVVAAIQVWVRVLIGQLLARPLIGTIGR